MLPYNIFEFGGQEHNDWIDVDNCTFEVVLKNKDSSTEAE